MSVVDNPADCNSSGSGIITASSSRTAYPVKPAGSAAEYKTPVASAGPLLLNDIGTITVLPAAAVAGGATEVVTSAVVAPTVMIVFPFAVSGAAFDPWSVMVPTPLLTLAVAANPGAV